MATPSLSPRREVSVAAPRRSRGSNRFQNKKGKAMTTSRALGLLSACAVLVGHGVALAQTSAEVPPSIVTPDKVETRLGPLQYAAGAGIETRQDRLLKVARERRGLALSYTSTCCWLSHETCEGCGLAAGERAELLLGVVAARGEKEIDRPCGVRFDLRAQGG
jgi:hypothetical protein